MATSPQRQRGTTWLALALASGIGLVLVGFFAFTGTGSVDNAEGVDSTEGADSAGGTDSADDTQSVLQSTVVEDSAGSNRPVAPKPLEDLSVSTVRLLGFDDAGAVVCAESGAIVTDDGAILTTAGFGGDNPTCTFSTIGVAQADSPDEAAELRYLASVVAAVGDFVVLRPTEPFGNSLWPPKPFVPAPLGFGVEPAPGAALRALGYTEFLEPDAAVRVSQTRLTVTGREEGGYLVDAALDAGVEGGMAIDAQGWVVGLVDVDGATTRVVPIDAARPALESGQAETPFVAALSPSVDIDFAAVRLSNPRFSYAVNPDDESLEQIQIAESGSESLCFSFAWEAIPIGATWDALWYRDGELQSSQASTGVQWTVEDDAQSFYQCAVDPEGLGAGLWEFGFRLQGRTMFVEAIEVVDEPPDLVELSWVNETETEICGFAVNPVAPLAYAGLNLFFEDQSYGPGDAWRYSLPPGNYIVEARDCEGELIVSVYDGLAVTEEMTRLQLRAS